jgi:kumamolisin
MSKPRNRRHARKRRRKKQALPRGYVRLEGSERRPSGSAKFLRVASPKTRLKITIALRRRPDGPPLPAFELFANMSSDAPRRLSPDEFAAKYGADPADIMRVSDFAKAHGLKVIGTHTSRRTVVVSGTVGQMNKAFHVVLGRYNHRVASGRGARRSVQGYRGRDGFIHIPKALAGIILGVFGLDDRNITKRAAADPPNTATLTVQQVASLYNFPSHSAAGQTIAIFSQHGYDISDLQQFFGTSMPNIIPVAVDAGNSGADLETTQDICIAGAAAPGASLAVYFTTYSQMGWFDLIHRVIHPDPGDPTCFVLSSSFYVSNGDDSPTLEAEGVSESWVNAVHAALQDAALQNVTFCTATGDYGVDTTSYKQASDSNAQSDGKAHVVYPASDPWSLACGGTTIGNINNSSFDEYVWNDSSDDGPRATGGGVSNRFQLPSYQQNVNVPMSLNGGQPGRGIPDVAGNASPNSGYPLTVGGVAAVGSGTSAVAPLYAGLIAILNAALGKPVGFLNAKLYALNGAVCRDVNPNQASPPAGPVDNGLNGVLGYAARPGWDACTGWGSINGTALLNALLAGSSPQGS